MEKITAVIFNRVPNHQTGQMGYADRFVGRGYFTGETFGMVTGIEKGWDAMTLDPIITVNYETGSGKIITHVIPYKDVELIYEDTSGVTEEPTEEDEVSQ
jgi:hypothetical protein